MGVQFILAAVGEVRAKVKLPYLGYGILGASPGFLIAKFPSGQWAPALTRMYPRFESWLRYCPRGVRVAHFSVKEEDEIRILARTLRL